MTATVLPAALICLGAFSKVTLVPYCSGAAAVSTKVTVLSCAHTTSPSELAAMSETRLAGGAPPMGCALPVARSHARATPLSWLVPSSKLPAKSRPAEAHWLWFGFGFGLGLGLGSGSGLVLGLWLWFGFGFV